MRTGRLGGTTGWLDGFSTAGSRRSRRRRVGVILAAWMTLALLLPPTPSQLVAAQARSSTPVPTGTGTAPAVSLPTATATPTAAAGTPVPLASPPAAATLGPSVTP